MSREEELERSREMVDIRNERNRLAELIAQKNPDDVTEDEHKQLQEAQRAYEKVRNVFVSRNLRLVTSMAKRYTKASGMEITDLINEGSIGIMRAVDKFDPERGVRFTTYAGWWIRHWFTRAVEGQSRTVRWPSHVQQTAHKIGKIQKEALGRGEEEPTVEELAEQMEKTVGAIKRAIAFQQTLTASLDAPTNSSDPNSGSYIDWIADDKDPQDKMLESKRDIQQIHDVVKTLNPREKRIIELRHGLNGEDAQTLQEIGEQFDLTRERIRQISNEVKKKLKKKIIHATELDEVV